MSNQANHDRGKWEGRMEERVKECEQDCHQLGKIIESINTRLGAIDKKLAQFSPLMRLIEVGLAAGVAAACVRLL